MKGKAVQHASVQADNSSRNVPDELRGRASDRQLAVAIDDKRSEVYSPPAAAAAPQAAFSGEGQRLRFVSTKYSPQQLHVTP